MKPFLKKLFLGKENNHHHRIGVIEKRVNNLKSIWNNDHHEDMGIEKLVRLLLAISQFLFPGLYIRHFIGGKNLVQQNIVIELYIILKVVIALFVVKFGWYHNDLIYWLILWGMIETLSYVSTLVFASDLFSRPKSYRRSMLLLFFNYLEIILGFALIYAHGDFMNRSFNHWFDPIYFSVITSVTIGYGDFFPVTTLGKILVSIQSILFFIFVVLFLNFFALKVESKGYFDNEDTH
jgi:hypothetical protein